jgi:hypothetical protein
MRAMRSYWPFAGLAFARYEKKKASVIKGWAASVKKSPLYAP